VPDSAKRSNQCPSCPSGKTSTANDDGDAVEVEIVGILRAENARQAEEILELRAKID